MKNLFALLLALISLSLSAQTTWNQINTPTDKKLNAINFPNQFVGYIGGEDSLLLKTTDGGLTWNEVSFSGITFLSGGEDFLELDFITAEIGFATIGPYTGTYKTVDGGTTWTQLATSGSLCYNHGLYFLDQNSGFVGGSGCFQGENMDKFMLGTASPVNITSPALASTDMIVDIDFNMNQFGSFGMAASAGGRILRTTDFGDNWDTISSGLGTGVPLTSITIVNDTIAYAGYDSGGSTTGLLMTTDAGLTWSTDIGTATFYLPIFHDVYSTPSGVVYSGCSSNSSNDGLIFQSTVSGVWNSYIVDYPIYNMTSYADTVIWAVGDSGYVVTTLNPSSLSIGEIIEKSDLQLYPNPAHDIVTLNINSKLLSSPFVAEIYSIEGTLISRHFENDSSIDISDLPSGTYILQVQSDSDLRSSKLVKL